MPANPGAKKAQEKAKKKRADAQKARAAQLAHAKARAPQVPEDDVATADDDGAPFNLRGQANVDDDELDELSAEAAVLIKKKKLEEAARVCADLVRRFPGEPDGWQRFAQLWEARGDLVKALAEMERAVARVPKEDGFTATKMQREVDRLRNAVAKGR